jgi:ParB family transcriptional regulator, chromosome partitioning protein
MGLKDLEAFTVSDDHSRQELVWRQLSQAGHAPTPYQIRRLLTEGAVSSDDKRAIFVEIAAYEKAGGVVTRDLFDADDGGWQQDTALLERLVDDRLKAEAEKIRSEGWKWIRFATNFPHGHTKGLRTLDGQTVALTAEETETYNALEAEYNKLEEEHNGADEVPDEVTRRCSELEALLAEFDDRPQVYDATEIAFAGAFISIDHDGGVLIQRGYVQPEDEPATADRQGGKQSLGQPGAASGANQRGVIIAGTAGTAASQTETEENGGIRPLADGLTSALTAFRTILLRDAVANNPHVAMTALLYKLCADATGAANNRHLQPHNPASPVQSGVPDRASSVPRRDARTRAGDARLRTHI